MQDIPLGGIESMPAHHVLEHPALVDVDLPDPVILRVPKTKVDLDGFALQDPGAEPFLYRSLIRLAEPPPRPDHLG